MTALDPGATIGIIGTGQLGRMLASAAAKLGFRVRTFGPDADPPAARVAAEHVAAAYDDEAALKRFAQGLSACTYEFENVPPETVRLVMEEGVPVRPDDRILSVCQDRLEEKRYLRSLGLATAPFTDIPDAETLAGALKDHPEGAILKTRRFGYDGKGQVRLKPGDDGGEALAALGHGPAILEGFVSFDAEVSQIAARSLSGQIAFYDVPRNIHENGILRSSEVPNGLPPGLAQESQRMTAAILEDLSYVGVIAVELFWSSEGGLIVNEMAPRVHNSGHWTHEACYTGQFEQHIRAVAGWPLGHPGRHSDAVMTNILGPEAEEWERWAGTERASLTLYGKGEGRAGRKMGHVTALSPLTPWRQSSDYATSLGVDIGEDE